MELNLYNETVSIKSPLMHRAFSREENAEVNLPESLPDVISVIDVRCSPCMRSKDADNGHVSVGGVCEAAVLYYTDVSPEIQCLTTQIPFLGEFEDPAVTRDCQITAKVTPCGSEARVLNSRKLSLRLELRYAVACYGPGELTVPSGVREDEGIHVLTGTRRFAAPTAIGEKAFQLTDTVKCPDSDGSFHILSSAADFKVDEVKPVGSKAVVKGSAVVRYICRCGSEGGSLEAHSFEVPFSQIVDLDAECDAALFDVQLMVTGLYLNLDRTGDTGDEINAEINAVAQCVAYGETEVSFIRDMYSTDYEFDAACTHISLPDAAAKSLTSDVSTVPDGQAPDSVIDAEVLISGHPYTEGESIMLPVTVRLLCLTSGGAITCITRRPECSFPCEACSLTDSLSVTGLSWESPQLSPGGEVTIPITLSLILRGGSSLDCVCSITCDEEAPIDRASLPSVTAYRVVPGDSLWTIAKKFAATQKSILAANEQAGDSPVPGSVLLIPRG